MVLNKKWGVGGLLLIIASFFLHPEQCYSSKDILERLLPGDNFDALATHIGVVVGTIILALAGSLTEKKPNKE